MRVGIYIGNLKPSWGGVFTYQESLIDALLKFKSENEYYIFYEGDEFEQDSASVRFIRLNTAHTRKNILWRIFTKLFGARIKSLNHPVSDIDLSLNNEIRSHKIEIIWFMTQYYSYVDIPFISLVWDVQHRLQPFFPEISVTGWKWDERERFFSTALPRAAYIITGTREGKEEIIKFYGVQEDRIKILPLATPSYVLEHSVDTTKYHTEDLPKPYIFYPAQFWPHKNHVVLLNALKILRDEFHLSLNAVFSGIDKGNLIYISRIVRELGLEYQIHFVGFVEPIEMIRLYKNAFTLVFPTFFGPDNLPPLEAFALGCPVIASDVPGAREQLGDAVLLVKTTDEREYALAIKQIYSNKRLRLTLIKKGLKRAMQYTARDYIKDFDDIINEFKAIRRCWSSDEPYKCL